MRIAQVAPLGESVPPKKYGGTERIVSYLTESLVQMGHEVTLYATADSRTAARLRSVSLHSLRGLSHTHVEAIFGQVMAELHAARHAYDLIHFHIGWFEFPIFTGSDSRCLTTLHGPLDPPGVRERIGAYPDFPLVSISDAQRRPLLARQNWLGTVYHGVPDPGIEAAKDGKYLAFLGRISPEKRPDLAIEIAQRAGLPIKLAAKVDPMNAAYFEQEIKPLLSLPGVEFLGELDEAAKRPFLAGAHALLFPIDWPEPFGLVMVEAFACGTPVVGFRRGSVSEVVEDGLTGYVVDDVGGAVAAVERAMRLDRRAVQARFRERFTIPRMMRDYLRLYERMIDAPRSARATSL
jgi:glycosyltransferase involved in cell wall biosynthesis